MAVKGPAMDSPTQPVVKYSPDGKTATITLTLNSVGPLPATPGDVSLVLFDPTVVPGIQPADGSYDFDVATLKCTLPASFGTWVTVKTKPAPLAPRKAIKVVFKGVAVPQTGTIRMLYVVDSACKSSPPIAQFGALSPVSPKGP
jgi:hypothetical protein